jgi:acyl dehydratase
MTQLLFSDLRVGQIYPLGPYAVTREELLAFAQEFDPQPFHMDEDVANSSVLGGLSTSGWHTSSILTRLLCDALFMKLDILGSSSIEEMKWLKPVYVGDVLSGDVTITGLRLSDSKPDRGIVTFDAKLSDAAGEAKIFMRSMVFVRVQP